MPNRSAVDTIKGYFYQFDYSVKRLLELDNDNDSVIVERIEDVDVKTATGETAVQCKYYSKTEYNHSVIAKSLRLMLSHFMNLKANGSNTVKYLLYGFYNGGQEKLILPISIDDFKSIFLTYKKDGVKCHHYTEVSATDVDLDKFISLLSIDINAQEYNVQLNDIFIKLKNEFNCSYFEAENYFYNNALSIIKQISIEENVLNRTITKKDFIRQIDTKSILFNQWFVEYIGIKKHFKNLKKEYFSSLNTSPFDRIFLIEIDNNKYVRSELKEIVLLISIKWSKISRRTTNPFCPFIYIEGIDNAELIGLKTELLSENHTFIDGFDFQGAKFCVNSILKNPNSKNNIVLKFINNKDFIDPIISESLATKEIYQFYLNNSFYENDSEGLKHIKIQIKELKNIKEII